MRIIVYGVGAIGGVVAGALAASGAEVIGIARGKRLAALRESGMVLRSPKGDEQVRFDCVERPEEIAFHPDDAILLTMKGQDTAAALEDLRAAGVEDQPIFCVQNGVNNERLALRFFPNVHGVNVMLPAEYMNPGETVAFCSPNFGIFDIGRFPDGVDDADEALAAALTKAHIAGYAVRDVMDYKHGKLIQNLGNIAEAAMGRQTETKDLAEVLRQEGRDLLTRLGIPWKDVGASDPRREIMKVSGVDGVPRVGSSTTQSLSRGTGSIETDYLNGEIVLIGRLHGIELPANAYAQKLGARLARGHLPSGSVSREEFAAGIGA